MLLDHFHPPLSDLGWKGFHNQWAAVLAADLNARLPKGWRAQPEVEFGIEVDVGVVEDESAESETEPGATTSAWGPPTATRSIPLRGPLDVVEVQIINRSYSPSLVGAIELVSPANKDRPDHRQAFVSKCHAILNSGAGLIVMDVVTERRKNLHYELMARLGHPPEGEGPPLYGVAYGVRRVPDKRSTAQLRIWEEPLELGQRLPTLALCLRVGPTLPVDFDATYQRACEQLRISVPHPV
jgi:hypothetical protein